MHSKLLGSVVVVVGMLGLAGWDPLSVFGQEKQEAKEKKGIPRASLTPAGSITGKISKVEAKKVIVDTKIGSKTQKLDIWYAEDMKIRIPPEMEFDDKGKLKTPKIDPTDKDRKLGGVKGVQANLKAKQQVVITVGKLPNDRLVATVIQVVVDPSR